jgi:hypothetical protein
VYYSQSVFTKQCNTRWKFNRKSPHFTHALQCHYSCADSVRLNYNFLFATASRLALGPTQRPIQWELGFSYLEVKRSRHEADHVSTFSAEGKNAWSYTSIPQYVSLACCLIKLSTGNTLPLIAITTSEFAHRVLQITVTGSNGKCPWQRPRLIPPHIPLFSTSPLSNNFFFPFLCPYLWFKPTSLKLECDNFSSWQSVS